MTLERRSGKMSSASVLNEGFAIGATVPPQLLPYTPISMSTIRPGLGRLLLPCLVGVGPASHGLDLLLLSLHYTPVHLLSAE